MLECAVAFGHSNGSWDNGRKSQKQPLISTRSTAAVSAPFQFMRNAAKGGSWKDQPFVTGAANDGGEPNLTKAAHS